MTDAKGPIVALWGQGFHAHGVLLEAAQQRVSDHFNERRHMVLLADAVLSGFPGFEGPVGEVGISREEIVLIVPLEERFQATDLRIEKAPHRLRLMARDWAIEGALHVVPGVSLERFLNVGQEAFVPITDAVVRQGDGQVFTYPLVLVQRRHIRFVFTGVPAEPAAQEAWSRDPAATTTTA